MTDHPVLEIPEINLYCDGACEPKNPGGVATYGWVLYERLENGSNGSRLTKGMNVVVDGGKLATNNYAEYCGLGFALRFLKDKGYQGSVYVFSDSKLLVNQVANEWKCNKQHLRKLRQRIWDIADEMKLYPCSPTELQIIKESGLQDDGYGFLVLQWIPREQNEEADALSKKAFVEHQQAKGRSTRIPNRGKS